MESKMGDEKKRNETAEDLAKKNKPGQPDKTDERQKQEAKIDEALEESFPASDPPAFNKTTSGSGE
jgi:hypothetical protein